MRRSSRAVENVVVIASALLCAGLIFGLLYDVLDGALRRWTDRDLTRRAHLIGVAIESHARGADAETLHSAMARLSATEDAAHLLACGANGAAAGATGIGREVGCRSELARAARAANGRLTRGKHGARSVAITAHALDATRTLFVIQDRTFLDARRRHLLTMLFAAAELALLALLLFARIGRRRAVEAVVRPIRPPADVPDGAERLRAFAEAAVAGGGLVVIANREPYSHERGDDGKIVVQRPASGLVTAIEPILRACGGTWVAHGGGSADRACSDRAGRVAVPPEQPEYTLRRLWIDEDEYERYYSGFANEGLWPLCHIAHTQPYFRAADWQAYQNVNEAFARAAIDETTADGMLLIQDYHFALVPRVVRERAPHVVTNIFWHIPWPNSEVFGICPWKESLLDGMLGADVVGFHTRQYGLNFLECAQRYLECRVDFDEMSVSYGGRKTLVRAYPISVEWPYPAVPRADGAALRAALGIPAHAHVSVGVDRADYTKGLLERVAAVEQLLEDDPSLIGEYVLVQLACPTRTRIPKYQRLADDLREAVERVNRKFGTTAILLQMRPFSPEEVRQYYAMADSALVTPLHDGMNLVAKEYVAACEDGDGALVLSVFAGAAKELDGALLVNPYDTGQVAAAILRAIRMPLVERRARMNAMREQVAAHSIYQWSETLLGDLCAIQERGARYWPQRVPAARITREVAAG